MILRLNTTNVTNVGTMEIFINDQHVTTYHTLSKSLGWITEVDDEERKFEIELTDFIEEDGVFCYSLMIDDNLVRSSLGYIGSVDTFNTSLTEEVDISMYDCGEGYMSSAWHECFSDEDQKRMSDGEVITVFSDQLEH